jgi:cathepsin F
LIVLALAIAYSLPTEQEARELFKDFKLTHNKFYESEKEEEMRFRIFQAGLARIEKENAESTGAIYGVNKFTDMTPEEFQQKMLTRRGTHQPLERAELTCGVSAVLPQNCGNLTATPSSWDWRDEGAVTGVKDQGQCGSCWSFGTTGDLEGSWYLAGHSLTSLSEQQLVSCDKVDGACNGGLQENAFNYIIKTGGIESEKDYPYTSGTGKVASCNVDSSKFVAHMSKWVQVASGASDESYMATYSYQNGPITIGINANPMQDYKGGIDNPSFCPAFALNHAVLIVGWGTQSGTDYWLIKNSWGTGWGQNGYYRIVRGVNKCGVAEDAVHSLV